MPSKQVISVSILCGAIVLSIAIWQWNSNRVVAAAQNGNSIQTEPVLNLANANDTWQNSLSLIQSSTTILTTDEISSSSIDTTLTGQMARDYFGQFLSLSQGGNQISDDDANQIAANTLANTNYIRTQAVTYTESNLHTTFTSTTTIRTYLAALNASQKSNDAHNKTDELELLNTALQSQDEADIAKLDPIIKSYTGMAYDLVHMTVPTDAIHVHLDFLNAISNILADITSMRTTLEDPVRGLAGVNAYQLHVTELALATQNLSTFFKIKLNLK